MNIIGEVKDRDVLILDDMVDTAGTLTQAAEAIAANGASRIFAACTHPVFSGEALNRINASPIEEVVVTNTVPLKEKAAACNKIVVLSVASLMGDAIKKIHEGASVNSLFV
jgi:ribose-phosphate pyrophosphokinase